MLQINQLKKIILILGLVLIINACGFHLRGQGENNLENIFLLLENNQSPSELVNFNKILQRQFEQANVNLIDQNEINKAEENFQYWQLNFIAVNITSRGLSRDSSGRSNEKQLKLTVDFTLAKKLKANNIDNTAGHDESNESNESSENQLEQAAVQTISETASYYQDYQDSSGERVQNKETLQLLTEKTSKKILRILRYQTQS